MCKKIILLLLICSMALAGFAQKNKQKSPPKAPKNTYFEILVSGCYNPKDSTYCPDKPVVFTFKKKTEKNANRINK